MHLSYRSHAKNIHCCRTIAVLAESIALDNLDIRFLRSLWSNLESGMSRDCKDDVRMFGHTLPAKVNSSIIESVLSLHP